MSVDDKVIIDRLHAESMVSRLVNSAIIRNEFASGQHMLFGITTGKTYSVDPFLMFDYPTSHYMLIPSTRGYFTSVYPYDLPIEHGAGLRIPLIYQQLFADPWFHTGSSSWNRSNVTTGGTIIDIGISRQTSCQQRNGISGRHFFFETTQHPVAVGDRFTVKFFVAKWSACTLQLTPMYNTGSDSYVNINIPNYYGFPTVGNSSPGFDVDIQSYEHFSVITVTLPQAIASSNSSIVDFGILQSDIPAYRPTEVGSSTALVYLNGIHCCRGSIFPTFPTRYGPSTGQLVDTPFDFVCRYEPKIIENHFPWFDATINVVLDINTNASSPGDRSIIFRVEGHNLHNTDAVPPLTISVDDKHVYVQPFMGPIFSSEEFSPNILSDSEGKLNIVFSYGYKLKLSINGRSIPGFVDYNDAGAQWYMVGGYATQTRTPIAAAAFGSNLATENKLDFTVKRFLALPMLSEDEHVVLSGVTI